MTESKAFVLIFIGLIAFSTAGIVGLAALGVRGEGLSLGALVPLAIAADLNSRAVMRYGDDGEDR